MSDGMELERSDVVGFEDPYLEALARIGVVLALGPGDEAAIRRQLTHPANRRALVERACRLIQEGAATNVELRGLREELIAAQEHHKRAVAVAVDLRGQLHVAVAENARAVTRIEAAEKDAKQAKLMARQLARILVGLLAQ